MATPADQRLLELLEKWLKSLELHAKYASLDDDSYWKIQPWVEHQRPSRWIIDVAKQKTLALKAHVAERVKTGDAKYSDSLELMIFLANLVGSEHIERFIPLAAAENERSLAAGPPDDTAPPPADTATREMPIFPDAKRTPDDSARTPTVSVTATREMPKFLPPNAHRPPRVPHRSPAPNARLRCPPNRPQSPRQNSRRSPHAPAVNRPPESRPPHPPSATGPRMSRARRSLPMRPAWCNGDGSGTSCRNSSRAWRTGRRCPRYGVYSKKISRPSMQRRGAPSRRRLKRATAEQWVAT